MLSAPWRHAALAPGDLVSVSELAGEAFRIMRIEDGASRRIEALSTVALYPHAVQSRLPQGGTETEAGVGAPLFHLADLPLLPGESDPARAVKLAVWTKPWRSQAIFVSPASDGFVRRGTALQPAIAGNLVTPLVEGETGRFDLKNMLVVRLRAGELQSVASAQLLNGANAVAVQALNGSWEVLQFQSAAETSPGVWELTGLLRGQLGTEDAIQAGSPAGSVFVLMNGAVVPAGLNTNEIGIELHWKAGPAGKEFTSQYFVEKVATGGVRALTPLAPVHLKKLAQSNGDVNFTWVRRGRLDADNWLASEIPLGESRESYRIRIVSAAAALIRETYSPAPDWHWTDAMQVIDASALPVAIEIAQMSEAAGAGITARLAL